MFLKVCVIACTDGVGWTFCQCELEYIKNDY